MNTYPRPVGSAYALVIGVSDYSAHDDSVQAPRGAHDLPAGKNDALALYRACRELGIAPENIHVLTSPALAMVELGDRAPGYVGRATRVEIVSQLAWLSQKLACEPGAPGAPVGLLAYSGHGDFSGDDLALCPCDVHAKKGAGPGEDLENVLPFYLVEEVLRSRPAAADNLTVLLDCSFASAQDAWGPGKRSSLTGRGHRSADPVRSLGACTLLAARPGEVARVGTFGGREQGALTWAVSVIAGAWRAEQADERGEILISLGDLVNRAKALLGAISLPQSIALQGPRGAPELCFLHRKPVRSVFRPEPGGHGQLDPDVSHDQNFTLYTLTLTYGSNQEVCQVLSVDESGLGYSAGKEYWHLSSTFLSEWSGASSLSISSSSGNWGSQPPAGWNGSTSSPQRDSSVSWSEIQSVPGTCLYASGSGVDYAIDFSGTAGDPTISWFIYASSEPSTGTYVVPAVTSFGTTAPSSRQGYAWYRGG